MNPYNIPISIIVHSKSMLYLVHIKQLKSIYHFFAGNTILCPPVVVEKLGGWKDPCPYDGSRYWSGPRRGKKTEETTAS